MIWWVLWISVAVGLLIVELLTSDLVSVWFSFAGLLVCVLTAVFPQLHWGWQVLIFTGISLLLLILTRPLVKKFLKRGEEQATNLELLIGKIAIVEEEIDNDLSKGVAKINGVSWSARSENGEKIAVGGFVVIKRINGNKLIVEKRMEKEEK